MTVWRLVPFVALFCVFPSMAAADGLVYQLPKDGSWARFNMLGVVLDSDEKAIDPVLNITGTLTICSVGTVRVDGETCRWIEIVVIGQRDGRAFKEVDKLLIPEERIGAGKKPLEHLREAWHMHTSIENGKPRRLETKETTDITYVHRVRSILHPPFENAETGDAVVVDCRLGKVTCERVTAAEKDTLPGSDIEYGSSYAICLHEDAPFGVTAWQATNRVHRRGELLGSTQLTLTLIESGEGAESRISTED